LEIYRSERLKMTSTPGESEAGFRTRLAQTAREQRDLGTENLRKKYASKFTTLQNRELSMRLAMEREADQVKSQKVQTVISFGTAILGAFLGRKMLSGQSAQRMGSAMKSASRMGKESMDVERARAKLEAVQAEIGDLEKQFQADMDQISASLDPTNEPLDTIRITAKSTDIAVEAFGLVWMPFRTTAQGGRDPDWK
jgi:hypothetical protein